MSSLGAQSFVGFCHEAAHISIWNRNICILNRDIYLSLFKCFEIEISIYLSSNISSVIKIGMRLMC